MNFVLLGHTKSGTRSLGQLVRSSSNYRTVLYDKDVLAIVGTTGAKERLKELVSSSEKPVYVHFNQGLHTPGFIDMITEVDPDITAIVVYRDPLEAMISFHNGYRSSYGRPGTGGSFMSIDTKITNATFCHSVQFGELNKILKTEFDYPRSAQIIRERFRRFKEINLNLPSTSLTEQFCASFAEFGVPLDVPAAATDKQVGIGRSVKSELLENLVMKTFHMITGLDSSVLAKAHASQRLKPSLLSWILSLNAAKSGFLSDKERKQLIGFLNPMVQDFRAISHLDISGWQVKGH